MAEPETVENAGCFDLERGRVELFELLVLGLERKIVDIVGDAQLLDLPLETRDLFFGRCDDVVYGIYFRGFGFTANDVDL